MSYLVVIGVIVLLILAVIVIRIRRRKGAQSTSDAGKQVYVGNLPYRVNAKDLSHFFSSYGPVDNVRIVMDRHTRRSKGFGFVTFRNVKDAEKALAAHGQDMRGRSMVVRIAKARQFEEN